MEAISKYMNRTNNTHHKSYDMGVWYTAFVAFWNRNMHAPTDAVSRRVRAFVDDWYLQTLKYTTQDQVGFPFVVQKHIFGLNASTDVRMDYPDTDKLRRSVNASELLYVNRTTPLYIYTLPDDYVSSFYHLLGTVQILDTEFFRRHGHHV